MRSLSSSISVFPKISDEWAKRRLRRPLARYGRASYGFLQRSRSAHRRGELGVDLRSRLRHLARSKAVEHFSEALLGEVLVGVIPDQNHRRVHAGTQTFHLFPAEIAVPGKVKGLAVNPALAHLDEVGGPAQTARRRAADLNVGLLAHGLQLEHGVERRDLKHADIGHAEQIGDRA